MQAAGHCVRLAVEFAACMQCGQHHFERGPLLHRVHVDRDAAAVIVGPDAAVGEQCDHDAAGEAGQRLVYGVVHDFLDQMVQTALAGRSDVHSGTFADGL